MINKLRNKIRKLLWKLDYTGERVILPEMQEDVITLTKHLSRYVFALKYSSNRKVLDIACGSGYGSSILSSVAKCITAIDIDKDVVKWAKKNNIFFCNVDFIVKDIEKVRIKGMFDIIISFETLEHLNDPIIFLKNIKSILSKEGKFIFSVPLNDPPNRFHKQRYNWKSISSLLEITLGKNIDWYSQLDSNILPGKNREAQFALGIWHKIT